MLVPVQLKLVSTTLSKEQPSNVTSPVFIRKIWPAGACAAVNEPFQPLFSQTVKAAGS